MRTKPPPSKEQHTTAYAALEVNIKAVTHISVMSTRDLQALLITLRRFEKSIPKIVEPQARVSDISRRGKRLVGAISTHVDRLNVATLWQVVMLVTCVEAYLQDILAFAAEADPGLMSTHEQVATYSTIASAHSLDDLARSLREKWARNWVNDGGPSKWLSRLHRMGLRGLAEDLSPRLELLWGIRHVAVHSAGVVTDEFARRHPSVGAKVGARLRVSTTSLATFVIAIGELVDATDRFFLKRYPSLVQT